MNKQGYRARTVKMGTTPVSVALSVISLYGRPAVWGKPGIPELLYYLQIISPESSFEAAQLIRVLPGPTASRTGNAISALNKRGGNSPLAGNVYLPGHFGARISLPPNGAGLSLQGRSQSGGEGGYVSLIHCRTCKTDRLEVTDGLMATIISLTGSLISWCTCQIV